jgi:hypothetical protein
VAFSIEGLHLATGKILTRLGFDCPQGDGPSCVNCAAQSSIGKDQVAYIFQTLDSVGYDELTAPPPHSRMSGEHKKLSCLGEQQGYGLYFLTAGAVQASKGVYREGSHGNLRYCQTYRFFFCLDRLFTFYFSFPLVLEFLRPMCICLIRSS